MGIVGRNNLRTNLKQFGFGLSNGKVLPSTWSPVNRQGLFYFPLYISLNFRSTILAVPNVGPSCNLIFECPFLRPACNRQWIHHVVVVFDSEVTLVAHPLFQPRAN